MRLFVAHRHPIDADEPDAFLHQSLRAWAVEVRRALDQHALCEPLPGDDLAGAHEHVERQLLGARGSFDEVERPSTWVPVCTPKSRRLSAGEELTRSNRTSGSPGYTGIPERTGTEMSKISTTCL